MRPSEGRMSGLSHSIGFGGSLSSSMSHDRKGHKRSRILQGEALLMGQEDAVNRGHGKIIFSGCERSNNSIIVWSQAYKNMKNLITFLDRFPNSSKIIRDSFHLKKVFHNRVTTLLGGVKFQT